MELTIFVHPERPGFWSEVQELPGCFASGRTLSELQEALEESISLYLGEGPLQMLHEPLQLGAQRARVVGAAGRAR
ncbi:MAG: type II toxin-antitoxin system HicB family antitoxin [Actinomycetota bacterium]|nr:type II toxin-antitoxin system HicB family antitoxin [Actinomycetota bacterium]